MSYNFGKSITRQFIAYENSEPINLPSQAPTIYLYSTQPTLSNAATGAGAISGYTVNYWLENQLEPYKRSYTVPAIPAPSSGSKCLGYWEAINFVNQTGATTQTVLRSFDVEVTEETDSYPDVNTQTLKDVYPGISSYLTDSQITAMLSIATTEVKLNFKNRGFKWTNLFKLNDIKLALAYKTIALASLSQIKESNDRHEIRYKEFSSMYEKAIESIQLPIDTDGDGKADASIKPMPSFAYVSR